MTKEAYNSETKFILFGAGYNGIKAMQEMGREKVAFFCDNDVEKQGKLLEGIKIFSFDEMLALYIENRNYRIMITPNNYLFLVGQLENAEIRDYLIYPETDRNHYLLYNEKFTKNEEQDGYLDKIVGLSRERDMLLDVSLMKKLSAEVLLYHKEQGLPLCKSGRLGEADYYGNLTSLIKYADMDNSIREFSPIVSHQDCMPIFTVQFQYRDAVIFSGNYYKDQIHKRYPYIPVYSIGPYIHYANGVYDIKKIEEIKKKIGRTLLIFLPHTIEGIERDYGRNDFLNTIIEKYRLQFDTVWLCVYWADLNDPICEYAEEKGIHIVTAGFRFDDQFNSRLKTIIELSDAVICGDIGTFISYSIFLNKPIGRIDINDNTTIGYKELKSDMEREVQFGKTYQMYESEFYRIFDSQLRIDRNHRKWMEPIAGFELIRSKKYIRCIFEVSKDIWILCHRNGSQYREAVRQAYYIYYEQRDIDKMVVLRDAVGWYLD